MEAIRLLPFDESHLDAMADMLSDTDVQRFTRVPVPTPPEFPVQIAGSKRVAERCGYLREGVLRSMHVKQDLREDTEIWSRLRSD